MSDQESPKKIPKLAYALIAAAGLGMLFLDNPFSQNQHVDNAVADVNGQEISRHQVDRMFSDLRARANPDIADSTLRQNALDALISQVLLRQHALGSGYQLSDQALYQYIKGEFGDEATYQQMLDSNRITAQAYQEGLRQSQSVENYYRILSAAATAPEANQALLAQLSLARDVHGIRIPLAPFAAQIAVDEAALAQYFQEHQGEYLSQPWVNISYLLLNPAALADPSQITAEQLAAARAQRAENVVRGGQYLIFDHAADAEQAAADIRAGNRSFADVSAAISQGEIAGQAGDLNPNAKGKGISKEVDEALFAIDTIGGVSPVFNTEYGAMLVQLGSIEGAENLDDAALRQEIAREQSQEQFSDIANRLFDAAQSGTPLADLAHQAGLSVAHLEGVNPSSRQAEWLSHAQVQEALFGGKALAAKAPVQAIDLGNASLFMVVDERGEAAPQPLENVREQVVQDYQNEKAKADQQAAAKAIEEALANASAELGELIAQAQGEEGHYSQLSYLSAPEAELDPIMYSFLMEQNTPLASHELPDQSIVVARIKAVYPLPEDKADAQLREMLGQQERIAQIRAMQEGLDQWLRAQSKIRVDNAALSTDTVAN